MTYLLTYSVITSYLSEQYRNLEGDDLVVVQKPVGCDRPLARRVREVVGRWDDVTSGHSEYVPRDGLLLQPLQEPQCEEREEDVPQTHHGVQLGAVLMQLFLELEEAGED